MQLKLDTLKIPDEHQQKKTQAPRLDDVVSASSCSIVE